jgi:hypothetical protein
MQADNNALEDALEIYTDLVLPHFDEPAEEFSSRFEALVDAVERSRDYPTMAVVTEYGEYPGKASIDVARRVAQLIRSYRYFEPDRTVRALVRLYLGARVMRSAASGSRLGRSWPNIIWRSGSNMVQPPSTLFLRNWERWRAPTSTVRGRC